MSCSLTTVARELARYKLDLVGVQAVRWGKRTLQEQGIIFFYVEKETNFINWEQKIFFCTPQK
jgi:hypothetical protein